MPYDVRAVMAGEDPAGVAAAKRVYGNMTLLAAVLNAAGAVVYDGSGVAQQIMQLTDVAAVSTATKEACDAEAECVWTSLEAARNNGDVTSSTLVGGKIINVEKEIPAVTALKQKLLEEN